MLYAGLDLSRKRLDFHLLDGEGATLEVGAAPPDADGLEEDVVLRVTRHSRKPPLDALGKRFSNRSPSVASSRMNERAGLCPPSRMDDDPCYMTGAVTVASACGTSPGTSGVSSRQCGRSWSWKILRKRKSRMPAASTARPMIFSFVPP